MRYRFLLALLAFSACKDADTGLAYFSVPSIGLKVPELPGWKRDSSAEVDEAARGGIVLRLVRDQAVPGSPRIDVTVTPKGERPLSIDEFLTKNLHEMTELEKNGSLRIASVDQRPIQIGPRRAFRIKHEYMMAGTVAITQSATLLVLDGRGVAVTASGRTELYNPTASSIEVVLSGLKTPAPEASSETVVPQEKGPVHIPAPQPVKPLVQPIDLGKVGGQH